MTASSVRAGGTLVLFSGGLDSAVLLAHEADRGQAFPLYVRAGLAWEALELAMVKRLLAHPGFDGAVGRLTTVEFSMRDVYAPSHWAIRGTPPGYDTPDEDVYLTGRNLVLLSKAGVVAASTGAPLPGCAGGVFGFDAGGAVAGARSRGRDRGAVGGAGQGGGDRARARTRGTARPHAVVHEPCGAGGPGRTAEALRAVQQVP